jgi:methionyl-tRNA synthetase
MSKSRGTFITAESYLKQGLNPEWLRYYYAAKLNGSMEDLDLSLNDFIARVNSDLVGKYINIASRCAGFITKRFQGRTSDITIAGDSAASIYDTINSLWGKDGGVPNLLEGSLQLIQEYADQIIRAYDARDFAHAIRQTMACADVANTFVNHCKPWELAKLDGRCTKALHWVCTVGLEMFRLLTLYLKPVLPKLTAEVEAFLAVAPLDWADVGTPLPVGHRINDYKHLVTRIERKQIDALIEANRESLGPVPAAAPHSQQRHAEKQQHVAAKGSETHPAPPSLNGEGAENGALVPHPQPLSREGRGELRDGAGAPEIRIAPEITMDDFAKVDLRIAKIVAAEHVDGADKLIKLSLDIGDGRPRQVFAGIKSAYDPAALIDRLTVMVANLAPRKMKFGLSEGMVLAASGEEAGLFLLSPDSGARPGMRVK